ncbi:hypothetical protein P7K49_005157 [Saguinus oedipus]|uniref:Uncharacterized protein n=1 Tax=Saguinus oedipus TaxID=9490 RepID=A0ABQ9W9V7_SAGOE|nr:hypothetical protein P7K49_005157 [Saguinus oedipus]
MKAAFQLNRKPTLSEQGARPEAPEMAPPHLHFQLTPGDPKAGLRKDVVVWLVTEGNLSEVKKEDMERVLRPEEDIPRNNGRIETQEHKHKASGGLTVGARQTQERLGRKTHKLCLLQQIP